METPRFVKDNLSKQERNTLTSLRENNDTLYMWEDKGPSFVKLSRKQYLEAGESEVQKVNVYQEIENDPSESIKARNDEIVDAMVFSDEIQSKVGEFLKNGQSKLAR